LLGFEVGAHDEFGYEAYGEELDPGEAHEDGEVEKGVAVHGGGGDAEFHGEGDEA